MRPVTVLGSTGSIGTQALDVARRHPDRFRIVGLSAAGMNQELLVGQSGFFRCPLRSKALTVQMIYVVFGFFPGRFVNFLIAGRVAKCLTEHGNRRLLLLSFCSGGTVASIKQVANLGDQLAD